MYGSSTVTGYVKPPRALSGWVTAMNVLTFIYLVAEVIYIPAVTQNAIFTFGGLKASSIPYFYNNPGPKESLQAERFYFEWWHYASDALRLITLFLNPWVVTKIIVDGVDFNILAIIFHIFMSMLEGSKLVYRGINWARCKRYQLCRSADAVDSPNWVFQTSVYMEIFFFMAHLGFLIMAWLVTPYYAKHVRQLVNYEAAEARKKIEEITKKQQTIISPPQKQVPVSHNYSNTGYSRPYYQNN